MSILPRIKIKIREKSLGKLFLRMEDPNTKKELPLHGQEAETHCKVDHAKYKIKDASFGVREKQKAGQR